MAVYAEAPITAQRRRPATRGASGRWGGSPQNSTFITAVSLQMTAECLEEGGAVSNTHLIVPFGTAMLEMGNRVINTYISSIVSI